MFELFGPEHENNRKRAVDIANSAPKGVGLEQMVPGAVVTFSSNKATGDRSYTETLWEVVGNAGNTVALKARSQRIGGLSTRIRVQFHEHEFYLADHLLDHEELSS